MMPRVFISFLVLSSLLGCAPKGVFTYNRAVSYFQKQDYTKAAELFSQASKDNPEFGEAYLSLGTTQILLAKKDLEKKDEREALGKFLLAVGSWNEAQKNFKKSGFLAFRDKSKQEEISETLGSFLNLWKELASNKINSHFVMAILEKDGNIFPGLAGYDKALKQINISDTVGTELFLSQNLPLPSLGDGRIREPQIPAYLKMIATLEEACKENGKFGEAVILLGLTQAALAKEYRLLSNFSKTDLEGWAKKGILPHSENLKKQASEWMEKAISSWKSAKEKDFLVERSSEKQTQLRKLLEETLETWEILSHFQKNEPHRYQSFSRILILQKGYLKGLRDYLLASRFYEQQKYEEALLSLSSVPLLEGVYLQGCAWVKFLQKKGPKESLSQDLKNNLEKTILSFKGILSHSSSWKFYSQDSQKKALAEGEKILKLLEQALVEGQKKEPNWSSVVDDKKIGEIFDATW